MVPYLPGNMEHVFPLFFLSSSASRRLFIGFASGAGTKRGQRVPRNSRAVGGGHGEGVAPQLYTRKVRGKWRANRRTLHRPARGRSVGEPLLLRALAGCLMGFLKEAGFSWLPFCPQNRRVFLI